MDNRKSICWAIACESINHLDGHRRWLDGCPNRTTRTQLFATRADAAAYIRRRYGYLRSRPDLRREPHGWRMPKPAKVTVEVRIAT